MKVFHPFLNPLLLLVISFLLVFTTACSNGGGGGGSGSTETEDPAVGITYSNSSPTYVVGTEIAENEPSSDATYDHWTINPDLPEGLVLDDFSGIISGTPAVAIPQEVQYKITASSPNGKAVGFMKLEIWEKIELTTGQDASIVVGQPDFTSSLSGVGPQRFGAGGLFGNPLVVKGMLFLPDIYNNRVLGYKSIPEVSDATADFVIGQPDMYTNASGTSATRFNLPQTVFSNKKELFVADYQNNRVLIYKDIPTESDVSADVVIGAPDMDTVGPAGCNEFEIQGLESAHATKDKLIVSDTRNNRVLIWNEIPTENGQAADIVLGQIDFSTCSANTGGVSDQSLSFPTGVWSDGKKLVVTDFENHRILVWNSFPTENGQPADVVIGQPDMFSNASGRSDTALNRPYALTSNGAQLFLTEWWVNDRVMVWNSIPTVNNQPADAVLGQSDFTTADSGTSAGTMNEIGGLFIYKKQLIVADKASRYLIFSVP